MYNQGWEPSRRCNLAYIRPLVYGKCFQQMCEIVNDLSEYDMAVAEDDLLSSYHPDLAHFVDKWIEFRGGTVSKVEPTNQRKAQGIKLGPSQLGVKKGPQATKRSVTCPICLRRFDTENELAEHREDVMCDLEGLMTPNELSQGQKESLRNYLSFSCKKQHCDFRSNFKGQELLYFSIKFIYK